MSFRHDFSDEAEAAIAVLYRKDRSRYETILKKIEEIVSRDSQTIDAYKNLRHDLKEYKRVHVGKSFVLLFSVFKKKNFILFDKLKHHDDAYKR
ncbi:MAG: addiction module toxin RelE [Candidatus Diapherotrites archaeon]|nr:addiction module toxin RelE [Candidatus Diapherotrites archaeon]